MASLDLVEGGRRHPAPGAAVRDGALHGLTQRLWRGKYLILALGLLIGGITYAIMSRMPAQYTSEGVVVIETQRISIPELQGVTTGEGMPDPLPLVRSELQQLRSRALLQEVVDEFGLLSRPEFNPALQPPGLRTRVVAMLREALPSSLAAWLPPPPGARSEQEQRAIVADVLARNLSAFNDNRSLIITLGLTARDPQLAAEVLNGIMNRYLAVKVEARSSVNREGNAALTARLAEVRADVEEIERRLQAQREQNNLITLRAGSVSQQQLEEMTTAMGRAATERQQAEAAWERARASRGAANLPQDLVDVLNSPTMGRLREREAEAARRAAEIANRFGANHPDRRAAGAELAAVRGEIAAEMRRIVNSLESQVASARQREQALSEQLARLRIDANRSASQQSALQQLEREADARRQLYQTLLARVEQTAVDPRNAPPAGARIVSPAAPPVEPSGPRTTLASGFGLLGGFTLGGLLSLLRGARRLPVTTSAQLVEETGLTVVTLPRLREPESMVRRVVAARQGVEAEALRSLRSGLRLQSRGRVARLVLFAAPELGHGATTTAASFARVAAMDGLKVLLVEGNLRQPGLAEALDVDPGPGLASATESSLSWRQALRPDPDVPLLDLLLASEPHGSARRVLESVRFQNLLAEAVDDYNLVVVDSAPASAGADFLVLAHVAEAAVLVVKAGAAQMEEITAALGQVTAASPRCATAVVLNQAAP